MCQSLILSLSVWKFRSGSDYCSRESKKRVLADVTKCNEVHRGLKIATELYFRTVNYGMSLKQSLMTGPIVID